MQPSVVLVLGTGASLSMGYPSGSALRQALLPSSIEKLTQAIVDSSTGIHREDVEAFATTFRDSQMISIDAFLARCPDMVDIGKRAIAAVLLTKEQSELLHSCDQDDLWYQYFFNHISTEDWNSLDFSNFGVITFNYDRSLEHYLRNALSASYNKPLELCEEKLRSLKIVHVYGVLGSTSPSEPSYFPYGNSATPENIQSAAERLRVIPEGRDEDETLTAARSLLINANNIAFLGFGFDKTNLRRLKSKETCAGVINMADGDRIRRVVVACLGMVSSEVRQAKLETIGIVNMQEYYGDVFINSNCLFMLRTTQTLRGDA